MNYISIAIPHYNNARYIPDTLKHIINDDRVNEIIICDDVSKDLNELENYLTNLNNEKIKLYRNTTNLGCYLNKLESLSKCTNEWCILLDSDNCLNEDTIDILYSLGKWDENIIYAPSWAKTFPGNPSDNLDYRIFKNKIFDKKIAQINFYNTKNQCLLNTCNYFLPVKNYLNCMNKYKNNYNRSQIDSLDSLILISDWLCNNYYVKVVENYYYNHRLHPNSNYTISKARMYEPYVKGFVLDKLRQV